MLKMKQYKYYNTSDPTEEAIGIIKAKNLKQAYLKAAKKKQLSMPTFIKIFNVKELANE